MPIGNRAFGLSVTGARTHHPSMRGNKTIIREWLMCIHPTQPCIHPTQPQSRGPFCARRTVDSTGQATPSRRRDGAGGFARGE